MIFGIINDANNGDKDIAKMHNEMNALMEIARTGHSKRPRIKLLETDEGGKKKVVTSVLPTFSRVPPKKLSRPVVHIQSYSDIFANLTGLLFNPDRYPLCKHRWYLF